MLKCSACGWSGKRGLKLAGIGGRLRCPVCRMELVDVEEVVERLVKRLINDDEVDCQEVVRALHKYGGVVKRDRLCPTCLYNVLDYDILCFECDSFHYIPCDLDIIELWNDILALAHNYEFDEFTRLHGILQDFIVNATRFFYYEHENTIFHAPVLRYHGDDRSVELVWDEPKSVLACLRPLEYVGFEFTLVVDGNKYTAVGNDFLHVFSKHALN